MGVGCADKLILTEDTSSILRLYVCKQSRKTVTHCSDCHVRQSDKRLTDDVQRLIHAVHRASTLMVHSSTVFEGVVRSVVMLLPTLTCAAAEAATKGVITDSTQ